MQDSPLRVTHSRRIVPRPGRPRSLTTDAIVRAAIRLGLDNLNMKALADELGVNVVTLYRHVKTKDELLRVAAFQLMLSCKLPDDQGEHWTDIARRYGRMLFDLFVLHPSLLSEIQRGTLGPRNEIEVLEQFLQALAKHGISAEEGVHLHRHIACLAMGAAIGVVSMNASAAQDAPWERVIRQALAERDQEDLPAVRDSITAFMNLDSQQWLTALEALLAGLVAQRGERTSGTAGRRTKASKRTPRLKV
jgi:AcrR family transcriptional regulator